jgi:hypothetical protein
MSSDSVLSDNKLSNDISSDFCYKTKHFWKHDVIRQDDYECYQVMSSDNILLDNTNLSLMSANMIFSDDVGYIRVCYHIRYYLIT